MGNEFVSIIIPTHNRKDSLVLCIDSINSQDFFKNGFEVIIVDDSSCDGTAEFIREYLKKMPFPGQVITQKNLGPGVARNIGAEKSRGDILAFTEDDVILDKNWLSNGTRYFSQHGVHAVEGVTKYIGTGKPLRKFEENYNIGFLPCNLMCRRNVFEKLNGYSSEFFDHKSSLYFREDIEFGFRFLEAGFKIIIAEDVIVYHPAQHTTLKEIYNHAKRYFFDPLLFKKHPEYFRKMIGIKKIGKMTIKRPTHYLSFLSVLFFLLAFLFSKIFLMFYAGVVGILAYKFGVKSPIMFIKILPLPFVYTWYFLKGCFMFKSYGAIL